MSQFLIIYDRNTGLLVGEETFTEGEHDRAIAARRLAEREYRGDRNIEVVLLGASNHSDLERTHSRYFRRLSELAPG